VPGFFWFAFVKPAFTVVLPAWFSLFPVLPAALPNSATVAKEAWWSEYNAGLPVAGPTTVPADALGVGNNVAGPDKIAAIGMTLGAPLGSTVQTLRLYLKESTEPGANLGAETAAVVACPITGTWEPVLNGKWDDRAEYDCALAKIEGKRSDEGIWSFNLAPVGSQWLSADLPLDQEGIALLVEQSATPVQVSYRSIRTGDFRLDFAAVAPESTETVEPTSVGELDVPEAPAPASTSVTPPTQKTEPETAVLLTQPAQSRRENIGKPNLVGNMPWGVWLLVPIGLGTAAAVSYALGPGMRRGRVRHRAGPVSRALSRRSGDG
jgi:hypothetical protein